MIQNPILPGFNPDPCLLHSAGFDASMLHDDDGKKYVVSLDWETRDGCEKPGAICLAEYDPARREIIGFLKRICRGGFPTCRPVRAGSASGGRRPTLR